MEFRFTDVRERHMARALELAERGRGSTSPNPMVGCVVVRDHEIVGEGWHQRAGEPHAEIHALRAAGLAARGSTVYVTLEPCNHHGRTPPCSRALIEAGVKRVIIAAQDPNPRVDGRGIEALEKAGIEVEVGVLAREATSQNEVFFTVQLEKRPFVLFKTAMTLDGKIATSTGESRWITGPLAREKVHRWRHELDAIAVGINTVLHDDPRLTTRFEGGYSPVKVIFDSAARTPPQAKLFEDDPRGERARVIVFATEKASKTRVDALRERGAEVITTSQVSGRVEIRTALAELLDRELTSVLLEGGGTLSWSFFEAQAVDRLAWFISPKLLGGNGASPLAGVGVSRLASAFHLESWQTEALGMDLLITGRPLYPKDQKLEAGYATEEVGR
ncbi:MAG: bifunctional diaminohydroxyphosphoribosylaminopyrimidine deaminase/5-amino-6-(5-phosphoribosylamino)uracil reductase RibD [Trueperaceae bacterium]|nr:MAG: bifunctional diaminohydroxyphosphoribosylaminopyrimidine deaminase/5-amino-6-(5-phosphoribosylamino)uracil reductase RibD [Trueperaceae bacterium]